MFATRDGAFGQFVEFIDRRRIGRVLEVPIRGENLVGIFYME